MCHARHFLLRQRNPRYREDVRRLFDREPETPESPAPEAEHELDEEPAAEPHLHVVTAHG